MSSEGSLTVCATPIGNLGDVSRRLVETLEGADVIYAEDTRRLGKLMSSLGLSGPVVSLFAGNERARTSSLVEDVRSGKRVVLVSDAGMPLISDPGAEAVRQVRRAGHAVSVIPGPSAVPAALAVAGFEADRFAFEGFLPRKGRERGARLQSIAGETRTVVLFASPHRLGDDLEDLSKACGDDRRVVVARELTKMHEEIWEGSLSEAAEHWSAGARGEITLVLEPGQAAVPTMDEAVTMAGELVGSGMSRSQAAREAARRTGVARQRIYEALLGQDFS